MSYTIEDLRRDLDAIQAAAIARGMPSENAESFALFVVQLLCPSKAVDRLLRIQRIRTLQNQGVQVSVIALRLGVGEATVYRDLHVKKAA